MTDTTQRVDQLTDDLLHVIQSRLGTINGVSARINDDGSLKINVLSITGERDVYNMTLTYDQAASDRATKGCEHTHTRAHHLEVVSPIKRVRWLECVDCGKVFAPSAATD